MKRLPLFAALSVAIAPVANAQAALTDSALRVRIDSISTTVFSATGVPSATVAGVRHGRLVYANAYGNAKLDPNVPATPAMRYALGSISKQFTASAILLLQEDGKLEQLQVAPIGG